MEIDEIEMKGSKNSRIQKSPSSRIVRASRISGAKDRHSKVLTSKGLKDRRIRLSVTTAIQFYDLQDRLGYDQPSKAIDWLLKKAADSISELPPLDAFSDEKGVIVTDTHTQCLLKSGCSSSSTETSKGSRSGNRSHCSSFTELLTGIEGVSNMDYYQSQFSFTNENFAPISSNRVTLQSNSPSFYHLDGSNLASYLPLELQEHHQQLCFSDNCGGYSDSKGKKEPS